MSTSSGLTPFLILVPDKPGTLAKRMEVRQQHIDTHAGRKGLKMGGTQIHSLRFSKKSDVLGLTLSYDSATEKVGAPNVSPRLARQWLTGREALLSWRRHQREKFCKV